MSSRNHFRIDHFTDNHQSQLDLLLQEYENIDNVDKFKQFVSKSPSIKETILLRISQSIINL